MCYNWQHFEICLKYPTQCSFNIRRRQAVYLIRIRIKLRTYLIQVPGS